MMNIGENYLKVTLYRVMHNKAYATFCILGTAFTFVFIIITLQLAYSLTGTMPPFVHADRTIVFRSFDDKDGYNYSIPAAETFFFLNTVKGKEDCYIYDIGSTSIRVAEGYRNARVNFVDVGYWRVNQFDFIEGRGFTEEECDGKKYVVVVNERFARQIFNRSDVIGEKMEVQGNECTIVGVVADYSSLTLKSEDVWIPYTLNKFVPKGWVSYSMGILVPESADVEHLKREVARMIEMHLENQGEEVKADMSRICTLQEEQIRKFGNDMMAYGIPAAMLLLLLIPSINIVTLNMANVSNYTREIALRRAMGASVFTAFLQVILESLFLVIVGVVLGFCLIFPVTNLIYEVGGILVISHLDYQVIVFWVLPLILIFTLLSGGIPAYWVSQKDIADTLKGGGK